MDVREKLGNSRLNGGKIIRLLANQTRFTQFYAIFNCVLQPTGAASDVISGRFMGPIGPDKNVKFDGHRTSDSREIPPEAIGGGIFDGFFTITSDRK